MTTPTMLRTQETLYERIRCQGEDTHLFAVREGVRADFAIQGASALLHSAVDALRYGLSDMPNLPQTGILWSAVHAAESAAAIVDALSLNIEDATS